MDDSLRGLEDRILDIITMHLEYVHKIGTVEDRDVNMMRLAYEIIKDKKAEDALKAKEASEPTKKSKGKKVKTKRKKGAK